MTERLTPLPEIELNDLKSDDEYDYDIDESATEHESSTDLSLSHTSIRSQSELVGDSDAHEWTVKGVKRWLDEKGLAKYFPAFEREDINGAKLLELTEEQILNEPLNILKDFSNNDTFDSSQILIDISNLMREIAKLKENEYDDAEEQQLNVDDILEFDRRLNLFVKKWERIAWIEEYVEENDGREPSIETIIEEKDIPQWLAQELLSTYKQKQRELEADLDKLFDGFSILEHGVIWFSKIVDRLQKQNQDSLWDILKYLGQEIPTPVVIQLLEHYKYELTRYQIKELDQISQGIIFGAQFPLCTAIRLSGYMKARSIEDLSRSSEFDTLASDYAKLAIYLLGEYTESDHLAAILLEIPSDIEGKSAIDLALEYRVIDFVSDKRVQRISNSLFQQWRFLQEDNLDNAFKTRPFTVTQIYTFFKQENFYFAPIGQFTTETFLFLVFLFTFTYMTHGRLNLFSNSTIIEYSFWVSNFGYVTYEFWDAYDNGIAAYIAEWTNVFDMMIVVDFLVMMSFRIWAIGFSGCVKNSSYTNHRGKCGVDNENLSHTYKRLNVIFLVIWSINTLLLWLRLLQVFFISRTVGPFIRMIANMMSDLYSFLQVFGVFFVGFLYAMMFVASKDAVQFRSFGDAFLIVFKAAMGELNWEDDGDTIGKTQKQYIDVLMVIWMIVGAIVLLNLLIALMAKTFDDLSSHNSQEVSYSQVKLAYDIDNGSAVMAPPLNLIVFFVYFVIFLLDSVGILLCGRAIPLRWLMPRWLRKEAKLYDARYGEDVDELEEELDDLIVDEQTFEGRCIRLKRAWFEAFKQDSQAFMWRCKYCRQQTKLDYSKPEDYVRLMELMGQDEKALEKMLKNSKAKDPVKRLGDRLGLNSEEVMKVRRLQPIICTRCYRRRYPINRLQIILELISYWIFLFFIKWILYLFIYPPYVVENILTKSKNKSKYNIKERYDLTKSELQDQMHCPYPKSILAEMPKSTDVQTLFYKQNILWPLVHESRTDLTPKKLRNIVERNILRRVHDREYERRDFFKTICGKNKIISKFNKEEWHKLKSNAAKIFESIQTCSENMIQLSHSRIFPFSAKMIQNYIESDLIELHGENFDFDKININTLYKYLPLLNIKKKYEQKKVLNEIHNFGKNDNDFRLKYGTKPSYYEKFLYFIQSVRKLIGNVRRIENMIRDVEDASNAHGINEKLILSHFHLVFEDIQNDAIATVVFRVIESEADSIEYKKILNFFIALKQMKSNCDRELLDHSRFLLLGKNEFLDIILKRARRRDEDSSSDEDSEDERMLNDTEQQKQQIKNIKAQGVKLFTRIEQLSDLKVSLTQIRRFFLSLNKHLFSVDNVRFIKNAFTFYLNHKLKLKSKKNNTQSLFNTKISLQEFSKFLNTKRFKRELLLNIENDTSNKEENEKKEEKKDNKDLDVKEMMDEYRKLSEIRTKKCKERYGKKVVDEDDVPTITGTDCKEIYRNLSEIYDQDIVEMTNDLMKVKSKHKYALKRTSNTIKFSEPAPIPRNEETLENDEKELSIELENADKKYKHELTIGAIIQITRLLELMIPKYTKEILSRGHELELSQNLFCKTLDEAVDKALGVNNKTKDDYEYHKIEYSKWSKTARRAASIFQHVHDKEQGHVTLGQVRDTIIKIYNKFNALGSITRLKNKLKKKKNKNTNPMGFDEMVDERRWWLFLVNDMGINDQTEDMRNRGMSFDVVDKDKNTITNTEQAMTMVENDEETELIRTATTDVLPGRETSKSKIRRQTNLKTGKHTQKRTRKNRKFISDQLFDLMEDQNGQWVIMRQIHVYTLWLTEHLRKIQWNQLNLDKRVTFEKFIIEVLGSTHNFSPKQVKEFLNKAKNKKNYKKKATKRDLYKSPNSRTKLDTNMKRTITMSNKQNSSNKSKIKTAKDIVGEGIVHASTDAFYIGRNLTLDPVNDEEYNIALQNREVNNEEQIALIIDTNVNLSPNQSNISIKKVNSSSSDDEEENIKLLENTSNPFMSSNSYINYINDVIDNDERKAKELQVFKSENELKLAKLLLGKDDSKKFLGELQWIFRKCLKVEESTDSNDVNDILSFVGKFSNNNNNNENELERERKKTVSWSTIKKFLSPFSERTVQERFERDLQQLNGSHEVFEDEFEQFKAFLNWPGQIAKSLFKRVRNFSPSISWDQILIFVNFLETIKKAVEKAIDDEELGEDEDPTSEELTSLLNIESQAMSRWLFNVVIRNNSNVVTWGEIREYLKDWQEENDDVEDYFEDLQEQRDKDELQMSKLENIHSKISNVKEFLDTNTIPELVKDELERRSKEELIDIIIKSDYFNSLKNSKLNNLGDQINNQITGNNSNGNNNNAPVPHSPSSTTYNLKNVDFNTVFNTRNSSVGMYLAPLDLTKSPKSPSEENINNRVVTTDKKQRKGLLPEINPDE